VESDPEFGIFFFLDRNGAGVKILPENRSRSRSWSLKFMLHSIDVTMIFVGFTASQQESNRSWSSTFSPKQEQEPEQESNFLE